MNLEYKNLDYNVNVAIKGKSNDKEETYKQIIQSEYAKEYSLL